MRRSVNFNVDASGGVDKRIPQFGGVRGEHHATELVFTMAATAPYREGDLVRLRFTCGDGAVLSSDLVDNVIVQGGRMLVSYSLPSVLTQAGGQLGARVVLSRVDESGREAETFLTDEAVLYFEDTATENGTPFWTGVSEMLKRTTTASDAAATARDAAIAAKHEVTTSAERASRFADAAEEQALGAVSAEKNAQLYASAAMSHRDEAENARMQALTAANAAARSVGIAKEAASAATAAAERATAEAERLARIDVDSIVQAVTESIGVPVFGTIGNDKTITLNEELPEGVYTLRYLTGEGYADIGTITVGAPIPSYVNLVPTALAHTDLTTVFNGVGYENDTRASSSTSTFTSEKTGYVTTGAIPVSFDTVLYIKGVTIDPSDTDTRFAFAKTNGNAVNPYAVTNTVINGNHCTLETLGEQYYKVTFNAAYLQANCPDLSYFFLSAVGSGENLIVSTTPIE